MYAFLLASALLSRTDSQPPGPVYNGRAGETKVAAPRVEATLTVDGVLSEPVWQSAATLTGFSQYQPVDQREAVDSTQVLVWYSPTAIHFGVRAFSPPGTVNANLSDRDKIQSDDAIEFILNTFNDGRQAFVFGVSALGVQSDGTINEGIRSGGRGFESGPGGRSAVDLSANFVFESRGKVTDFGYVIEVRIPFKSLRYQSAQSQDWGLQVVRKTPYLGHENTWTAARLNAASFLAQGGTLVGLTGLQRGLVVDVNPSVVAFSNGSPKSTGDWRYVRDGPEFGGTARWGLTNNLTANATVNPDFSQVEADVAALQFDPRQALFYPERRPFFLEGIENFAAPDGLIYSRRVVKPDLALKLSGKASGTNVALLGALDDRSTSFSGDGHPVFAIARLTRDVGAQSRVGFTYTDRYDGNDYNRVFGTDFRAVARKIWSATGHYATSATRRSGASLTAPLWSASLDRNGRTYDFSARLSGVDPDFRSQAGFIGRTDVIDLVVANTWTIFRKAGSTLESFSMGVRGQETGRYDPLVNGRASQDRKLHFTGGTAFRGGWRVRGGVFFENFGFDSLLYKDYYIERTLASGKKDTAKFTAAGDPRLHNIDVTVSFNTPEWSRFGADMFYIGGKDENFDEWQSGMIHILTLNARYRPTDQLRVEAQYQHQQYDRWVGRSSVNLRRVPRLKVEYQASRFIFLRLVGQYDAQRQDALRDDQRTNFPLLARNSDGSFSRLDGFTRNRVRMDWLFSYQPSPGTVLFVGYGSSLAEASAFRFKALERQVDGFFVKWSYNYRL